MPHVMIVSSPYYPEIAEALLAGATNALQKSRCSHEVFEVAGALEIPMAIKLGAQRREGRGTAEPKFDAFLALGCVLRGETSHYDLVCAESARGLSLLALEYDLIIGNAILTCETMAQAQERAAPGGMNKGGDAVAAIMSLLEIKRKLRIA